MKRCSAENAKKACWREYKRIQEEESGIKQGQSTALVSPGGASVGTPQGQPAAGSQLLVPKQPLGGATGGKLENALGPGAQANNLPELLLPVPAPGFAQNAGQSGISEPQNGGVISGTTSIGTGTGGSIPSLTNIVQQTTGQGGASPGGSDVLSPAAGGSGPVSVTNSLEGGRPTRIILVAVVKRPNAGHNTAGPETIGETTEITDATPQMKGLK